jgi:GNAT superfamily N-acetyltransferase
MIRAATIQDVPELMDMGLRFVAQTAYADYLKPDKLTIFNTLTHLIESPNGIVLVNDDAGPLTGAILGALFPHFVTGEIVCGELAWWVEPEARGQTGTRLLHALEDAAKAKGAVRINVAQPPGNPGVGILCERRGYRPAELTYTKALL